MPIVVFFMHALCSELKFFGFWVDLSLVLACLQFMWYTIWGVTNNVWWMGPASLPIITLCYSMAHVYTM